MTGQIYVERLDPLHVRHKYPLVFIAGNGQTGTVPLSHHPITHHQTTNTPQNWLNTPDNRPGWASFFLNQGYTVYLTDQAQRGRSAYYPNEGQLSLFSAETVEKQFTAPQNFPSYPKASLHTQWPGTGLLGDPVFDALYASQVPAQNNATLQALYNNASYAALLEKIGPAIVLAHSQAGPFGWKLADVRPRLVKALVALEPEGPPFENYAGPPFDPSYIRPAVNRNRPFGLTLLPLAYDPPLAEDEAALLVRRNVSATRQDLATCILQAEPARRLVKLAGVPVLFVTSEASYHAVYDYCTVAFLRQAGVGLEFMELGKVGVKGNGHFMFLERNNLEVAARIEGWLERYAG
jgi:pimeloyl-ACP methyl ester carboxylesterase